MSCSFRVLISRCLQGCVLAVLMVLPFTAAHAQSASSARQFNSTTISDQINLQVLDSVVKEIGNSFTRSCTDTSGTIHAYGTTWATSVCPLPQSGGQVTYICISGYTVMQNNSCH